MCCARASALRAAPTVGAWPRASAALVCLRGGGVGGRRGCPRRDGPALKTGQLKLGAGAARGSPLPSPARVGAAFARGPGLRRRRSGVLVPCSRRPRRPRPQNPPSLSVPCDFSVASAAPRWFSHAERAKERAWRQFDMPNSFFLPLFAFILAATHFAPRNRAVLQKFKHALAGVTL